MKVEKKRILERKLAREISSQELETVLGGRADIGVETCTCS